MKEIAFFIIWIIFSLYVTVCPFICLYWCHGGIFYKGNQRIWRANHKILTNIIGFGGFIGIFSIISIGVWKMLWFLPFLPEYLIPSLGIISFFATVLLYDGGYKIIQLKEKQDREQYIQHVIDNLRRNYYGDWSWHKEELDSSDEEIRQTKISEIREQIDKLNKSIGSATNKGFQIRKEEELEALYTFLDEVSNKNKQLCDDD